MFNKCFKLIILFIAVNGCYSVQAQSKSFISAGKKLRSKVFDKNIEMILQETGIPAISIAIIEDNKVVFSNGYGIKEKGKPDKVNGETLFEGCSLSKTFLVYLAYRLVDEGKLELNRPLYKYLPYKPLEYDERYKKITAKMVLNHSSGLENWQAMNDPQKLEILSAPGEKFGYSGEGFNYLAAVIEVILGVDYEHYMNELVYAPLNLERTFSSFSKDGNFPLNYAIGHQTFGTKVKKMKNDIPVPAGGNHFTAKDYATLITTIFDGKHLSLDSRKTLLDTIVSLKQYSSSKYFYGQGFEIMINNGDTIISQGGSNPGFKALLFYSVPTRRGFVMLTNSDRGKWIAEKISELTVKLNLKPFFEQSYQQYPSQTISLLKSFDDGGKEKMFQDIESYHKTNHLEEPTLNELADIFNGNYTSIAKEVLEQAIIINPDSPKSFYLLGSINMKLNNYTQARDLLLKAQSLHSDEWDLKEKIASCEEILKKRQ